MFDKIIKTSSGPSHCPVCEERAGQGSPHCDEVLGPLLCVSNSGLWEEWHVSWVSIWKTHFSASFQFLKLSNPTKKNANVFIIKLRSELISITNSKHYLTFALCYPYNIITHPADVPFCCSHQLLTKSVSENTVLTWKQRKMKTCCLSSNENVLLLRLNLPPSQ